MMQLYVLEQRQLWGDYGYALISGYARRNSSDGFLHLKRAGPFLPPISFPLYSVEGRRLIVSGTFRSLLEGARFPGLSFRPVVKERVVRLDWHVWDLEADHPQEYPLEGDPFNYIEMGTHSPAAAATLPDAWELCPSIVPLRITQLEDPRKGFLDSYLAYPDREDYPPLFRTREEYGRVVVTASARSWFEQNVGEWVVFRDIELRAPE
jgi:hypothetical protein